MLYFAIPSLHPYLNTIVNHQGKNIRSEQKKKKSQLSIKAIQYEHSLDMWLHLVGHVCLFFFLNLFLVLLNPLCCLIDQVFSNTIIFFYSNWMYFDVLS